MNRKFSNFRPNTAVISNGEEVSKILKIIGSSDNPLYINDEDSNFYRLESWCIISDGYVCTMSPGKYQQLRRLYIDSNGTIRLSKASVGSELSPIQHPGVDMAIDCYNRSQDFTTEDHEYMLRQKIADYDLLSMP